MDNLDIGVSRGLLKIAVISTLKKIDKKVDKTDEELQ